MRTRKPSRYYPAFPLPEGWEGYCRPEFVEGCRRGGGRPGRMEFLRELGVVGMGERYRARVNSNQFPVIGEESGAAGAARGKAVSMEMVEARLEHELSVVESEPDGRICSCPKVSPAQIEARLEHELSVVESEPDGRICGGPKVSLAQIEARLEHELSVVESEPDGRICGGPKVSLAQIEARLEHELSVVEEVGYADYFLIVWDIVREAHVRGIPTLARGSAADSLLCYCLKISTVCPLRFDLYFERFLNRERMKFSKLADIDIDFPWDQRDEMMEYVFEKYGRAHVAMIGGFNRFHGRAAVGDIGKVYGLSEHEVRYFTKRMPRMSAESIAKGLGETVRAQELPVEEEPYPEILETARRVEGFPRHMMMHPCGIVVSRVPLAQLMPLMPSGRGPQMTQFDMDAVEEMGLVKIDLLGQAGLSVLRDVLRMVKEQHGVEIDLDTLPWEDVRTWDYIAGGNARGVHHIESPAMTSLLVQSNCRDMDCLCAIVSVIRPGAADEAKKLAFTRRHQGFEAPCYPHESLEPYLKDTYGLLVYEEHILMVAHHFAGMNLGRSDVLRRELVKMKSPELLLELGREFRGCALAVGRDEEDVKKVWYALVHFHGYMFNKAHSASYAVEAFHGAYLKARYPAIYMAAVLENGRGFYTPLFYVLEARRLGVRVSGPCVNRSGEKCSVFSVRCSGECENGVRDCIRVPVDYIRGLGAATGERWWRERRERGMFAGLEDFYRRVRPGAAEMQLLIDAGALDCFAERRTELFWQVQRLQRQGNWGVDRAGGQRMETLFGYAARTGDLAEMVAECADGMIPEGLELTEPSARERAALEMEALGFPVSMCVFDALGESVPWESYCAIADLKRFHGEKVRVAGLVVQTRHNHTSKGEVMMFCTLADPTGFVECSLFPKVYRKCGIFLEQGKVVSVRAEVQAFDNGLGQTLDVRWAGEAERVGSK